MSAKGLVVYDKSTIAWKLLKLNLFTLRLSAF